MEQHPVPQNVTTFQFRLIGDMTIKQFGFLAGGAILAYISYKLPLPFFFSWPLTTVFALGGIGFAFVPIEERPMDVWVLSFIKNVYSPTIFTWEKSNAPVLKTSTKAPHQVFTATHVPAPATTSQAAVSAKSAASVVNNVYAQRGPVQPPIVKKPQQEGIFTWLERLLFPKPVPKIAPAKPQQAPHIPTPSVVGHHLDISMPPTISNQPIPPQQREIQDVVKKEEVLNDKARELQHELENKTIADSRIVELQKQLTEVLAQKDKMEAEMLQMQKKLQTSVSVPTDTAVVPPPPPVQKQQVQTKTEPTVKIITPEGAVKAGLPRLTTFPNVVTGITKDSDNNLLPGVLVTVKDKEGVPVRALKTNRLGQFAASTPLSNGVYFVEIEDPRQRYTFDRVQITLNGSIVPALEIITKSQKQISRDKLAKELFGTNT